MMTTLDLERELQAMRKRLQELCERKKQEAKRLFKEKKFEECKKLMEEIVYDYDGNNYKLLSKLGDISMELKEYKKAGKYYSESLEKFPDDALIYIKYGNLLHEYLENNMKALIMYDRAIKIEPNNEFGWFNYAKLMHKIQRFDLSETYYSKCITERACVCYHRALLLLSYKPSEKLLITSLLKKATVLQSNVAKYHHQYAVHLESIQSKHEAQTEYEIALSLSECTDIQILSDYARFVYESMNNYNSAMIILRKALKLEDVGQHIVIREYYMQIKQEYNSHQNVSKLMLKSCRKCDKFSGYMDGYCSLCFKQIFNLDNYGIAKSIYTNALKSTPLECIQDFVISFVLYPREYYHDKIKDNDDLKNKQLIYDDWYLYSKKNRKLKRSINILKKMIAKQNNDEFIELLCDLQPWMKAKDICDIIICLPPISMDDDTKDYRSMKIENAQKIMALTYFGLNFFENHGEYLKKIVKLIMSNDGGDFICYQFFNFGEGPYWKYFGRHVFKYHISHGWTERYVTMQRESVDKQRRPTNPPKLDRTRLFMSVCRTIPS